MNTFVRRLFASITGMPALLFLIGAVWRRSPHLFFGGAVSGLVTTVVLVIAGGVPRRPPGDESRLRPARRESTLRNWSRRLALVTVGRP